MIKEMGKHIYSIILKKHLHCLKNYGMIIILMIEYRKYCGISILIDHWQFGLWMMEQQKNIKAKKKSIDGEQLYIRPAFHLCTHCFTEEENKQMADWFKRRYLVEPKIAHDNRRDTRYSFLRFSAIDTEKIYKIIRPYVLQIESMKEKFKFIEDFYFPN